MQKIEADRQFVRPRPLSVATESLVRHVQNGITIQPVNSAMVPEHSTCQSPAANPQSSPGHIFQPKMFGSNQQGCQAEWPSSRKIPHCGQSPAVMMSSSSVNEIRSPSWPTIVGSPHSSPGYVVAAAANEQPHESPVDAEQCRSPLTAARPAEASTLKRDSPPKTESQQRRMLHNLSMMPQTLAAMEHPAFPAAKSEPDTTLRHDQTAVIEHSTLPMESGSISGSLGDALDNALSPATNAADDNCLSSAASTCKLPGKLPWKPQYPNIASVTALPAGPTQPEILANHHSSPEHASQLAMFATGNAVATVNRSRKLPWNTWGPQALSALPDVPALHSWGALSAAVEKLARVPAAQDHHLQHRLQHTAATASWATETSQSLASMPSSTLDSCAINRKRPSQNPSDHLEPELAQPFRKQRCDEPLESRELSNKELLNGLDQFEFSEMSNQSSFELPPSSMHLAQRFRYVGVWYYTTEHQNESRYAILAGSRHNARMTFVEGTCADCVSGSLEPDGEWLKAQLLGNEGTQVMGTIRLRFDLEHGTITSQFMAPGAPAWGKETNARRCSEEQLASERKLVLGTWCYGEESDEYIISEIHGKFQYSERDATAALDDVGIWLQAELLGPQGALLGTVRVRLLREQGTLVSQFRAFGSNDWKKPTIARRSQKTFAVESVSPVQTGKLSEEQQRVVDVVCEGENVFFTGLPGTGKSFTLCAAIAALRSRLQDDELAVCASTGSAACHIGGGTVHSFLGCGLGKNDRDFAKMTTSVSRLSRAKALVIDEISMLSGDFLEGASLGLKKVRKNQKAFGGLQVVLCGDFLQLPPVLDESPRWKFAFQAPCWNELNMRTFELTQNFRQAEDIGFQEMLQRLRLGKLSDEDRHALLNGSKNASQVDKEAMEATTLFCRNIDVERQNLTRLAQLPGETVMLRADDKFTGNRSSMKKIVEKCMAPHELQLKIGARVMLLKNLRTPKQCKPGERPLVNGSLGTVVGFQDAPKGKVPVVAFTGGRPGPIRPEKFEGLVPGVGTYTRLQVPLKLAWAISVHKSQGSSLDAGTVDLHGAFEAGQVYVALSRFRSSAAIAVQGLPAELRVSQHAKDFHDRLSANAL